MLSPHLNWVCHLRYFSWSAVCDIPKEAPPPTAVQSAVWIQYLHNYKGCQVTVTKATVQKWIHRKFLGHRKMMDRKWLRRGLKAYNHFSVTWPWQRPPGKSKMLADKLCEPLHSRARILKHLLEAGKSTFRKELSFQRSESTTGFVQASVFVKLYIKNCFISILTDLKRGRNSIITIRVLSFKIS